MTLRIFLNWLLFLPVPIINGFLREKWYKEKIGEMAAHIVGVLALGAFFLLYVYYFFSATITDMKMAQLFSIGSIWLVLTLIFEFGLGLAAGRSWSYMLADYNILKGRIWPFLLLVILFSPLIILYIVK